MLHPGVPEGSLWAAALRCGIWIAMVACPISTSSFDPPLWTLDQSSLSMKGNLPIQGMGWITRTFWEVPWLSWKFTGTPSTKKWSKICGTLAGLPSSATPLDCGGFGSGSAAVPDTPFMSGCWPLGLLFFMLWVGSQMPLLNALLSRSGLCPSGACWFCFFGDTFLRTSLEFCLSTSRSRSLDLIVHGHVRNKMLLLYPISSFSI